jgi:hypothetical protein
MLRRFLPQDAIDSGMSGLMVPEKTEGAVGEQTDRWPATETESERGCSVPDVEVSVAGPVRLVNAARHRRSPPPWRRTLTIGGGEVENVCCQERARISREGRRRIDSSHE